MSGEEEFLRIKFRGGKNLSKLEWRVGGYMKEILPWASNRIRSRVVTMGTTADGRPFPRYTKKYRKQLARRRLPMRHVRYWLTGDMWRSLATRVTGTGVGESYFKGAHESGGFARYKSKKTGKITSTRALTNQALASILAFREAGKPLPTRPKGFVPPYAFMDLDPASCDMAAARYDKYWKQKVQSAPPAL